MPEILSKSFFLILIITLGFILSQDLFSVYIPYIIAALFLILYIKRNVCHSVKGVWAMLETGIFTFAIILLVMLTNGVQSPFFFLFYILLVYVSLFLEPFIAIITTIALFLFLLLFSPQITMQLVIQLASLFVFTPVAIFMGNEVLKERKQAKTISTLQKDAVHTQEDTYLFLSLVMKQHVHTIVKNAENFMGDHELNIIKRTAQRMKTLIDDFESRNSRRKLN